MRPTRAGLSLILVCFGLLVGGRLLGLLELYILGAMVAAALLLAFIYTLLARLDLGITRTATPARLRAANSARIDISLRNRSRRRTPVLAAQDHLQDGRGASVLVGPIAPGGESRVAYRLPAQERGPLLVGPLDLTVGDPLGVAASKVRAADQTRLMVHARLIELDPLSAFAGVDPSADQQPIRALATAGDEFFALRPYVVGDELRRVDWRASARFDELVVRQEERPKTGRVTIVLDVRSEVYDRPGFERAVSASLSVLYAAFRGGDSVRFVSSALRTPTDIRTRADLDAVDEQLALIKTTSQASLASRLEELAKSGQSGSLIVVTGVIADGVELAVERVRRSFGQVIVMACNRGTDTKNPWVTVYDDESDLALLWRQSLQR